MDLIERIVEANREEKQLQKDVKPTGRVGRKQSQKGAGAASA